MPDHECQSEELQEVLRLYRRSSDRRQNSLAALRLHLRELSQVKELQGLERVKKAGDLLELLGQVVGVCTKPSAAGVLETLGKAIAEVAEAMGKVVQEGHLEANQVERLRILEESLRLDVEEDIDRREAARGLVDAFWECTERLAPRRIRFALTVQSVFGFLGVSARAEMRCEGEAELTAHGFTSDPAARPWRCLYDPDLVEFYAAEGELTVTLPCYEWAPGSSGVQVHGVSHEVRGGPLRFRASMKWVRGRPSTLELFYIAVTGALELHVEGTVVVFGQGQSLTVNVDLAQTTTQALSILLLNGVQMETAPGEAWQTTLTDCDDSVRRALEVTVSR